MNKKSVLMIPVAIASILFMSSCATVPTKETSALPAKEFFITQGYDEAWKTTAAVVNEHYPISILDKESGLISTEVRGIPETTMRRIAVCPTWASWVYKEGRARISVSLRKEDLNKTKVRITPYLEWYDDSDKRWKIVDPAPAFYDEIVSEILRRSPPKVE